MKLILNKKILATRHFIFVARYRVATHRLGNAAVGYRFAAVGYRFRGKICVTEAINKMSDTIFKNDCMRLDC